MKQPHGLAAGARPAAVSTLPAAATSRTNCRLEGPAGARPRSSALLAPVSPAGPHTVHPAHGPVGRRWSLDRGVTSAGGDSGTTSRPQQVSGPCSPSGWRPSGGAMHVFGNREPTGSPACTKSGRHQVSGRDASRRLARQRPPESEDPPERPAPGASPGGLRSAPPAAVTFCRTAVTSPPRGTRAVSSLPRPLPSCPTPSLPSATTNWLSILNFFSFQQLYE